MSAIPFDQRDGIIWFDGKIVPWRTPSSTYCRTACIMRSACSRASAPMAATISSRREHSERLRGRPRSSISRSPTSVAELDAAKPLVLDKNGLKDAYVRPVAWRGSRDDGRRGPAQHHPRGHRHLGMAEHVRRGPEDEGHPARHRRLPPARSARPRPATSKAAGLYMICTISKHRAERKGYADALMLDWQGRVAECTGANVFFIKDGVHPHADRRLLPRRHHAPDGDRPRQAPRHRGDRAADHAGGARQLRRVLHHRHGRRGDAGLRDRPLHASRRGKMTGP